jgi:hypothetical protein
MDLSLEEPPDYLMGMITCNDSELVDVYEDM